VIWDTYYLNNAVYFTESMLKSLASPTYDGIVDYWRQGRTFAGMAIIPNRIISAGSGITKCSLEDGWLKYKIARLPVQI
jgi:hypothetical protein